MKIRFAFIALAVAATLSACSSVGTVTRDGSAADPASIELNVAAEEQSWTLADLRVSVPETLIVSESNSYAPSGDIVWRDDPYGDRRQQVAALMHEAMVVPLRNLDGTRAVVVDIQVTRFHALTERARYTVGGRHAIQYVLTVSDAETGEILAGPRPVDASFPALGGRAAIASEAQGIGQRERIQSHLALRTAEQFGLSSPGAVLSGL